MSRAIRKLSEEDRQAIDLLLDHTESGRSRVTRIQSPVSQKRIEAAENLLKLIGQLPVIEPPKNLVAKTLKRIDRAAGRSVVPQPRPTVQAPPA